MIIGSHAVMVIKRVRVGTVMAILSAYAHFIIESNFWCDRKGC